MILIICFYIINIQYYFVWQIIIFYSNLIINSFCVTIFEEDTLSKNFIGNSNSISRKSSWFSAFSFKIIFKLSCLTATVNKLFQILVKL